MDRLSKKSTKAARVLMPLNMNSLNYNNIDTWKLKSPNIHSMGHQGAQGKKRSLRKQKSMLDIIDDTTLTSLPLIPPLKANNNRFNLNKISQNNKITKNDADLSVTEKDDSFAFENDTFEDQIVLIEDYIEDYSSSDTGNRRMLDRKESLANFKQKLNCLMDYGFFDRIAEPSNSSINTVSYKRAGSNDSGSSRLIHQTNENLEDVLGKLPDTDLLKYCSLCEKPLYELSSLLNNNNIPNSEGLQTFNINNKEGTERKEFKNLYNEFVCGECVELYEDFFDELYLNQLEFKGDESKDNLNPDYDKDYKMKLISIFGQVKEKYDCTKSKDCNTIDKHIDKKPSFSEALLNSLKALSEEKDFLSKSSLDFTWLREFQHKLRWRWRINGLIPKNSKFPL